MRYPLISFAAFLISLWTVSSGVDDKNAVVPNCSLTPEDQARLTTVLAKAWNLQDPVSTSYAVLTFAILKIEVPKSADVCKYLQTSLDGLDGAKAEPVFAVTSAMSKLPSCKANALKPAVKQAIEKILKDGGASQDVFYAAEISKGIGAAVDAAKLAEVLKASLKSDDGPQSLGYAFWATSAQFKTGQKVDLWDRIEDVVAQADEVDKQYLQFEGGLSVTAAVINGVVRLAQVSNKAIPLTSSQIVKFGNYLVSRKTVTTPRGAWLLVSSLDALSRNKFAVPVFVGLSSSNVLTDANKVLSIRCSDLLGRPLDVSIQLESVSNTAGVKVANVEFIQAIQSTTDKTLYTLDLKSKPLPKGFYKGTFTPKSSKNDKALILVPASIEIKVTGKLGAVTARVGVAESDQQSRTQWHDLNKNQKLSTRLEFEPAQKLVVKIAASDSLHQVFVLLRSKESKREVAFIAQPDAQGKTDYKLELDLTSNAKDLNYKSGIYEVTVILGDFLIEDSIEWNLGEVNLQVAQGKSKSINPLYAVSYEVKPEIKHVFRTPEPRPPRIVSDAFTVLTLVPLLVLLALWMKIGANIKAFPFTLSALGFHLGLLAIFGVYGVFWLRLTMFEAVKWMAGPGLVTFLCGHRLLAQISERRGKA